MIFYQTELLNQVSAEQVEAWLLKNPVPENWQGNKWSYAFWYMERKFND